MSHQIINKLIDNGGNQIPDVECALVGVSMKTNRLNLAETLTLHEMTNGHNYADRELVIWHRLTGPDRYFCRSASACLRYTDVDSMSSNCCVTVELQDTVALYSVHDDTEAMMQHTAIYCDSSQKTTYSFISLCYL